MKTITVIFVLLISIIILITIKRGWGIIFSKVRKTRKIIRNSLSEINTGYKFAARRQKIMELRKEIINYEHDIEIALIEKRECEVKLQELMDSNYITEEMKTIEMAKKNPEVAVDIAKEKVKEAKKELETVKKIIEENVQTAN